MSEASAPVGGCLALLGGGEFSFGETEAVDQVWLERCPPGPIGFLPAASGSVDYGRHFTEYMQRAFGRPVEVIPVYRPRDARRGRNAERILEAAAVYLGGGVADTLIESLADSPAGDALARKLGLGGTVVAIAAAAQACGIAARTITGDRTVRGLGLIPGGVLEANFEPAHDRRLRRLLASSGADFALGLPAGSALLLSAGGAFEAVGTVFRLTDPDADLEPLVEDGEAG